MSKQTPVAPGTPAGPSVVHPSSSPYSAQSRQPSRRRRSPTPKPKPRPSNRSKGRGKDRFAAIWQDEQGQTDNDSSDAPEPPPKTQDKAAEADDDDDDDDDDSDNEQFWDEIDRQLSSEQRKQRRSLHRILHSWELVHDSQKGHRSEVKSTIQSQAADQIDKVKHQLTSMKPIKYQKQTLEDTTKRLNDKKAKLVAEREEREQKHQQIMQEIQADYDQNQAKLNQVGDQHVKLITVEEKHDQQTMAKNLEKARSFCLELLSAVNTRDDALAKVQAMSDELLLQQAKKHNILLKKSVSIDAGDANSEISDEHFTQKSQVRITEVDDDSSMQVDPSVKQAPTATPPPAQTQTYTAPPVGQPTASVSSTEGLPMPRTSPVTPPQHEQEQDGLTAAVRQAGVPMHVKRASPSPTRPTNKISNAPQGYLQRQAALQQTGDGEKEAPEEQEPFVHESRRQAQGSINNGVSYNSKVHTYYYYSNDFVIQPPTIVVGGMNDSFSNDVFINGFDISEFDLLMQSKN